MAHPIKGGAIIAGIGQTEFSKNSGRSELQLAAEASRAAILDAGLTPDQIDGMVTFTLDTNDELALSRNLGVIGLKWWSETPWGGAGANSTIQHAAAAVTSGAADAVLVYRAFNERSGRRFGQPNAPRDGSMRPVDPYYTFGLDTPAKTYALWYQRYMHEYGVTNEDFGRYTVVARKHAATNPAAWFYQRPITIEDHQASRWIVEPILRKLDCCQESDGGVAIVITRDERAADLPNPAVRLAGISEAHFSHGHVMYNYYWDDIAGFPEAKWAGDQVYEMAGVTADDIDVCMIYENFSPVVFLQLEAFGFCGRGEAKDFIADGNIEIGGKIPLNTNGGLLGEAYIHGVNNVLEGTRQIRGTAANQVTGAEHVLCATGAGAIILTPA